MVSRIWSRVLRGTGIQNDPQCELLRRFNSKRLGVEGLGLRDEG